MKLLLIIVGVFALANHPLTAQELLKENKSDNSKLNLTLNDYYSLNEEAYLVPNISTASVFDRENLVIFGDGSDGILYYSEKGMNQKKIGGIGRGPFEFSSLSLLKLSDEKIYIWDENLLKLTSYAIDGKNLLEIQDFRWAVKDMEVVNNDVFFYESGNINSENYISRYDINTNTRYTERYGKRTQEDIFLGTHSRSGGIGYHGNHVYYVSPSSLSINRINLSTKEEESFKVTDEDFEITEVSDARQLLSRNPLEINKALMSSSYIVNLFAVENYLVIMSQIGEASYNSKFQGFTAENLKFRFYIVDYNDMNVIDTFTFSVAENNKIQDFLWVSSNKELVLISPYDIIGEPDNSSSTSQYKVYFFGLSKASN